MSFFPNYNKNDINIKLPIKRKQASERSHPTERMPGRWDLHRQKVACISAALFCDCKRNFEKGNIDESHK